VIGILEYWNGGMMGSKEYRQLFLLSGSVTQHSIFPTFHHSMCVAKMAGFQMDYDNDVS
jgi:hypothetical protein